MALKDKCTVWSQQLAQTLVVNDSSAQTTGLPLKMASARARCHNFSMCLVPIWLLHAKIEAWTIHQASTWAHTLGRRTCLLGYGNRTYTPNPSLLKLKVGRRKRKRLKGDMDACNESSKDKYSTGDFDEVVRKGRCSSDHIVSHNKASHKKRNAKSPSFHYLCGRFYFWPILYYVTCYYNIVDNRFYNKTAMPNGWSAASTTFIVLLCFRLLLLRPTGLRPYLLQPHS